MARIALDAMGGDHAPAATIAGALLALQELAPEHGIQLVGRPEVIRAELDAQLAAAPAAVREQAHRLSVVEAAALCSTTPARELGLTGFGLLADGAAADLVVLDRGFRVVRTFIDGQDVFSQPDGVRPQ